MLQWSGLSGVLPLARRSRRGPLPAARLFQVRQPGLLPWLQVNPSGGLSAGSELLYDYGQGGRPLDFVLRYGFCPRFVPGQGSCPLAPGGAPPLGCGVCFKLTKGVPPLGLQVAAWSRCLLSTTPAQGLGALDTGGCSAARVDQRLGVDFCCRRTWRNEMMFRGGIIGCVKGDTGAC